MRFAVFAAALLLLSVVSGALVRASGFGVVAASVTAFAVLLLGQFLYLGWVARLARAESKRRALAEAPTESGPGRKARTDSANGPG